MAEDAIQRGIDWFIQKKRSFDANWELSGCYIEIIVPAQKGFNLVPEVLHFKSFTSTNGWKYPFDKIARSKSIQLWSGRNNGNGHTPPHLLFLGETPYYGGVKRDGIIVTCSGFEESEDSEISTKIASELITMARVAFVHSEARNKDFIE